MEANRSHWNVLALVGIVATLGCDGSRAPAGEGATERGYQLHAGAVAVYASEREVLKQYSLDVDTGALTLQSSVTLPLQVHYAAADDDGRQLYVSTSNGSNLHQLFAFDIAASGALTQLGAPLVPSGGRIIHLSVSRKGRHLALAHNQTARAAVVALADDGALAGEVSQAVVPSTGFFPHQAKFDEKADRVIVSGLGADATATAPEQAGTITTFDVADGQLTKTQSITLGPGLGARHLDFHPNRPFTYVAIERGNRLYTYGDRHGRLSETPLYDVTTLADPGNVRTRQRAGAIHVHPNGRVVYVSNRADATAVETIAGVPTPIFIGGENSIAAFSIDVDSGRPTLLQHVPTQGFEARTFTIDPTGRYLIVGNQVTRNVRDGDTAVAVPRSIVVFAIADDGRLEQRHKYDIAGPGDVFWLGSVALPHD